MNLFDQRVIYSDDGVLTDISPSVNDFRSGATVIPMIAGEDYIYIGTAYPWSARYFEIGVANNVAASVVIELYDNGAWVSAVDILDFTKLTSAPLSVSGYIRFLRNRDRSWTRIEKSHEVVALPNTLIYDMFWMRVSFTADLLSTASLKFIGQKFSDDSSLYALFPDLNQAALKSLFQTGKTNWDEQHYMAAQAIVDDMKARNMIISQDQVLDPWAFSRMSSYKVAEMIYGGLGDSYMERKKAAAGEYQKAFSEGFKSLNLDVSQDGTLSRGEQMVSFSKRIR
jgi:hypothetical protein